MSYILVAEDDRDLLLLVQRKLELSGYENVWMTHNGEEALKHALESPPRLMILDIMLPGMDGLTVCSEVKDKLGENLWRKPVSPPAKFGNICLGNEPRLSWRLTGCCAPLSSARY
jgi:CheY-like chemotaxis protein